MPRSLHRVRTGTRPCLVYRTLDITTIPRRGFPDERIEMETRLRAFDLGPIIIIKYRACLHTIQKRFSMSRHNDCCACDETIIIILVIKALFTRIVCKHRKRAV